LVPLRLPRFAASNVSCGSWGLKGQQGSPELWRGNGRRYVAAAPPTCSSSSGWSDG
jgi:hypothetical protein